MKKTAIIVGIVGAMFLTTTSVIAQTESATQKLGAPGASPESDKEIGTTGTRKSANQKLGAPGASPESDKDIGATGTRESASQKLGAPGASPESDKNIGPGPSNSPSRGSAPPKGKK